MNKDILKHIGVQRSQSIIIAMEDDVSCLQITRFINDNFPKIPVITKSENIRNSKRFKRFGASKVIAKNLESGLQLAKEAIKSADLPNKIDFEEIADPMRDLDSDFINSLISEDSEPENTGNQDK
jgi:Trk K+ transport system NAD-binding subunit